MPVDDAPEDDEARETYNFAPGYHGLVYRADVPDYGAGNRRPDNSDAPQRDTRRDDAHEDKTMENASDSLSKPPKYKLQAMKWGES